MVKNIEEHMQRMKDEGIFQPYDPFTDKIEAQRELSVLGLRSLAKQMEEGKILTSKQVSINIKLLECILENQ